MAEILNQFTYTDVKGKVINGEKGFSVGAKLYGTAVAGQAVKLKNVSGSKVYVVEAVAADTDAVFGFIPYESAKKNSYVDGDMVTVMCDYTIMVMEASAAINGGAEVMAVVSGQKVATATTGKTVVGYALQPAATTGDLIAVKIQSNVSAVPLATVVALSAGATAVMPITAQIVKLTTTTASAISLADGSDGQRLSIILVADGGTATITPAHFGNGSTVAMDDAGDSLDLVFTNSKWYILANNGCTVA